jgi:hypothetical protein
MVHLNVVQSLRNSGIDLVVNEDYPFCRVIAVLTRCLLNPACLQPIPIPEETKDETAGAEMELCLEEHRDPSFRPGGRTSRISGILCHYDP